MSSVRHYVVTPRGGDAYRVSLAPAPNETGAWIGEVGRGHARWRLELAPGPGEDLMWVATRPVRWRWDATSGRLVVDGQVHDLVVETEAAHRLSSVDGRGRSAARVEEIRAPMPGLVLAVEAEEGQTITAGQGIVIIEAMKMENEITAPVAGIVRGIGVAAGKTVERGALLCRIDPPGAAP